MTLDVDALRELFAAEIRRIEVEIDAERGIRLARREDDLRTAAAAANALEYRLESMNQFREQLSSQAGTFATRSELATYIDSQAVEARTVAARAARLETWQARIIGGLMFGVVVVPIITALVTFLLTRNALP